MSRPSLLVRVAGSPLPALALFAFYACVVVGWHQGHLAGWLALATTGACLQTFKAVKTVRRYKAWLADWKAMDESERPAQKRTGGMLQRALNLGAVSLAIAIPLILPNLESHRQWSAGLSLLWMLVCAHLIAVMSWRLVRRIRDRRARQQEAFAPLPVRFIGGRASSSPSRAKAARKLPDYARRLLR